MNAKSLITLNNEYRERLTSEHKKYYEKLLVYIRLNTSKSEQETEEILYEILEHLLEAQEEGKKPEEVFGEDPKAYADEIIGELPKAIGKEQVKLGALGIINFIGSSALCYGLLHFILNLFIKKDSLFTFGLGSGILITIIDTFIAFLSLVLILKWLRSSVFENKNKWIEFLQVFAMVTGSIGLFFLVSFLMPTFGPLITLPIWSLIPVGIVLLLLGKLIEKL